MRVNLTPDIGRQFTLEEAEKVTEHAIWFRDGGAVGLGLGGLEVEFPPEPFARVFAEARAAPFLTFVRSRICALASSRR